MMKRNIIYTIFAISVLISLLMPIGCERDINVLEPATYPDIAEVFIDGFSAGLQYAAFGGSKVDAFQVDTDVKYSGTSSMRIAVPDFEDPYGAYAGGAYYTEVGRNLTGYDALTFWAKASKAASIDIVGIGNDLTGASKYVAVRSGLAVNTNWKKYYIPIPDAAKLTAERGMFFYSEGPEDNKGYTIWFDEVKFEKTGLIAHPKPVILEGQDQTTGAVIGDVLNIGGTYVIFGMPDGTDKRVEASQGYFTFVSSNESVATVDEMGAITVVGLGEATITAKLGSVDADGSIKVTSSEAPPGPQQPAPTPTVPADQVISLFSNAYTNVPVDKWSADWDDANVADVQIAGDDVKLYTNLNFAGIEFTSQPIDASAKSYFHMDIWTPDPTAAPAVFKIKLVDFGPDGAFGGGDDSEHEITLDENTTPPISSSNWVQLDIPFTEFTSLLGRSSLAQIIISGDPNTVYVDNIYVYGSGGSGTEPTIPAPVPTEDPADVISLFSNAYSNVNVDTWSADWDDADLADVQIAGDDVKLYTNLTFAGIEFTSQTVDATEMTHFHMDVWTPDPTAVPAVFKIKLVDFGADGAFGGGDDTEHEIFLDNTTAPAMKTGSWAELDIPFTDFLNLTNKGHLAQLIISGDPNTVYIDNVYFFKDTGGPLPTEPSAPAPDPTFAAGDVISMFSNSYTNVNVDTWSADWDSAELSDIQILGNDIKLYTNLVFAGIETTSQTIDATGMTHFHLDIWTPDPTAAPAVFKVKLVDFGADGAFQGGDDVEHEIFLDNTTVPSMATSRWVKLDIPLTDFVNLTTRGHIAQIIISGDPNTVYVDNMLFHK